MKGGFFYCFFNTVHAFCSKVCCGMGGRDWHVACLTSVFQGSCGSTVLDSLASKKPTNQSDWQPKQLPQVDCPPEDLRCWGA